jgi:glycosyltransferase involved in cell wall biosynthesis
MIQGSRGAVIWHLIDSRTVGGAERHIGVLLRCLRKRNIAAEAVLYRGYGINPWLSQLSAENLPYRVLDGTPRSLVQALAKERPNLLHVHGYKSAILGRLPARLLGIPVVTTFHSGERSGWPLQLYEWADEWTSGLGERIAVSSAVQSRLPLRSTLITNFLPENPAPTEMALPRRVAFVGRLSAEKGPDLFCALATQAPAGLQWDVYGDGPMRHELEVRYSGAVTFHGVVPDLDDVWPAIGLLIMPSRFEGLPYSALEALAAGVPILASRVGGLPDAVKEDVTGWLFEAGDLRTALAKIDKWMALDASAQERMRLQCWRHAKESFSEASEIAKLMSVYRKAGYAPANSPSPGRSTP